jgi:phage terminase large subunit-like protein
MQATESIQHLSTDELESMLRDVKSQKAGFAQEEPFYFYKPHAGVPTSDGIKLLKECLLPEDVPQTFDSQFDIHFCEADTIGVFGGNQSGKTISSTTMESLIAATGEVPNIFWVKDPRTGEDINLYPMSKIPTKRPYHIRITCEDYLHGIEGTVLPKFRTFTPKDFLIDGQWDKSYAAGKRTLSLVKNRKLWATVEFMSNQQDVGSFQGPPKDMLAYDEEPRKEIHKENLMRLTTADKLRVIYGMTPTKGLSWVYGDVFEQQEVNDKIRCFQLASVCNPYANVEILRAIVKELDSYEEIKMRLLGEFVSLSGRVYKNFKRKIHVIPPFEVSFVDYCVVKCMDVHQVTPSHTVWIAIDRMLNTYIVDSCATDGDVEQIKKEVKDIEESNLWRVIWSVVDRSCDSDIKALKGINIFKLLKKGVNKIRRLRKSVKYAGSIDAGVETIKGLLKINKVTNKPRLFILDTKRNAPLINTMLTLEREQGTNEDVQGPKDKIKEGKHHRHAAMRYGFQFPIRFTRVTNEVLPPKKKPFDAVIGR